MSKEDSEKYFDEINKKINVAYAIASEARKEGYDPVDSVEIPIAKNMAERVVGLISSIVPQIKDTNIVERIHELEKEYGSQDWRVALKIAEEVTKEKFCKFKDKLGAMEVGIRVGIAYVTNGVVASPLEGFTGIKIRKRRDGGEYFSLFFSGPIRSAGGTGASVSVLIGDYIRKIMGYQKYDPDEKEISRFVIELRDYHEKITNLQYFPSEEELKFMVENLPVQIDGDPSEKYDVSNYKGLDRMDTNKLRNGVCLVLGEGLTQKAPKLWAKINTWGKEFGMDDWFFLDKFLKLQKSMKAKEKKSDADSNVKIKPDYTYINDLVAGRPVLGHPLRNGAFRLRYGRARNSGLSGTAIHPATMIILNEYIAIGTQLKWERPGKGTVVSSCDSIEGPIVKLNNGCVLLLENVDDARKYSKDVEEIIFLGDALISYGDFKNRAHPLVPCGYNEEWWKLEFDKAIKNKGIIEITQELDVDKEFVKNLFKERYVKVSFDNALKISKKLDIPMHPRWTYHFKNINQEQFLSLMDWLENVSVKRDEKFKIILPFIFDTAKLVEKPDPKRVLELLGIPHLVVNKEYVVIEGDDAKAFAFSLGFLEKNIDEDLLKLIGKNLREDILELINKISGIKFRDKNGTFIGARMGRPEKAKIRKMTGSPHVLFPVGAEGGRLRCFQEALDKKSVTADFPVYLCEGCSRETIYPTCEYCHKKTKKRYYSNKTKMFLDEPPENITKSNFGEYLPHRKKAVDINYFFDRAMQKLRIRTCPDLIKGVRGMSNEEHIPENLAKGILRAFHDIQVNKDGTIRYDMTELPITHFKPKEIGTSVERLKELGYEKDIEGKDLINDEQILELKVQDVILPSCDGSFERGADEILFRVGNFVDDLLVKFYDMDSFYNFKEKGDLVGHLVLCLAPHISAGMIGRIVGFSKTQGFYAHPYFHCAVRRDCFDYNTFITIKENDIWKNLKIGDLVERLNPEKVVDNFNTKEIKVENYKTIGVVKKLREVNINNFTKHSRQMMYKLRTSLGKEVIVTENHKFIIDGKIKRMCDLNIGDRLPLAYKINIKSKDKREINLLKYLKDENLMVRGISNILSKLKQDKIIKILDGLEISKKQFMNFRLRDSYPLSFVLGLDKNIQNEIFNIGKIAAKRDNIETPIKINLGDDLLEVIGLYIAEGYSRTVKPKKGLNQVYIASNDVDIKNFIKKVIKKYFGLIPTENKNDRVTFSSKIFYLFISKILGCGNNAKNKRIPSLFLDLPCDRLACVLRGYYEGDGSVSLSDRRVSCDSVSDGLLYDLEFCLGRFGIFVKRYKYKKQPGPKVRQFYINKKRDIPEFEITKLIIGSNFVDNFMKIGFLSERKKRILRFHKDKKYLGMRIDYDENFVYDPVILIDYVGEKESYCLNIDSDNHLVLANSIISKQCDGDEAAVMLLMDALLNFSRKYLPGHRGAKQDAPLVLTSCLIPGEVDDMVFDMDIVNSYGLEFYEATQEYKLPGDIKLELIKNRLGKDEQYFNFGFTHDTTDINLGVTISAYKKLPTMMEKVFGQMDIAEKIRAVDEDDVARLIIERHFMRDIKGNLRKFSQQEFRCVACNEKFRRPPLTGVCLKCGGKIIFTIAEGGITKYMEPALSLAEKYDLPAYLRQDLELTQKRIESVFSKDKEKQEGLGKWFG